MTPTEPSTPEPSIFDSPPGEPRIAIPLTEEQQALIQAMTGEHATVLELAPDADGGKSGTERGLRFMWRLSTTTGIPRQVWDPGYKAKIPAPDQGASS